jgi:hypothetical protein
MENETHRRCFKYGVDASGGRSKDFLTNPRLDIEENHRPAADHLKLDLENEWHQIHIVMAEMIHFIRQMQAYCQLEVIECSWKVLIDFMNKKEGDLDAMIDAHRTYLDRMVKKVLLLSSKTGKEVNVPSFG